LKSIIIPESVKIIDYNAFENCSSLQEITIPENVRTIEKQAFRDCVNLMTVKFNAISFETCSSELGMGNSIFLNCNNLTFLNIGNKVKMISCYIFYGCSGLKSVTIPENVEDILMGAFEQCSGLREIHNRSVTPQNLRNPVFYGVDKNECILYVPIGSRNAYRYSEEWWNFQNIIEEKMGSIEQPETKNYTVKSNAIGIIIETSEELLLSVYNLSGQKIHQSVVTKNTEISLDKGMYIVKVNNKNEKVIVR